MFYSDTKLQKYVQTSNLFNMNIHVYEYSVQYKIGGFCDAINAIIVAVIGATLIPLTQIISKEVHGAWKKEHQKTKIV